MQRTSEDMLRPDYREPSSRYHSCNNSITSPTEAAQSLAHHADRPVRSTASSVSAAFTPAAESTSAAAYSRRSSTVNARSADSARDPESRPDKAVQGPPDPRARRRIDFRDADIVRARVRTAAAEIRGAQRHVLDAALSLLLGWKRIHDDYVSLAQLTAESAPEHRHDDKTVGRALKALAAAQFFDYTPARGRGRRATLAIHPRFLDGIVELERDNNGQVVPRAITFSSDAPYSLSKSLPPNPQRNGTKATHRRRNERGGSSTRSQRPISVPVADRDILEVVTQMPAPFAGLTGRLRGTLVQAIRRYLGRGFLPRQILAILGAKLPDQVKRPVRLALWRFTQNLGEVGPRLKPLQQAFDAAQRAAEQAAHRRREERELAELHAATTAQTRARILAAMQIWASIRPHAAADSADHMLRMARVLAKRHGGQHVPLATAIRSWLDTCTDFVAAATEPTPSAPVVPLLDHDTDTCIACTQAPGRARTELPLASVVCDDCWRTELSANPDLGAAVPA